jgi:hypothetical protein
MEGEDVFKSRYRRRKRREERDDEGERGREERNLKGTGVEEHLKRGRRVRGSRRNVDQDGGGGGRERWGGDGGC